MQIQAVYLYLYSYSYICSDVHAYIPQHLNTWIHQHNMNPSTNHTCPMRLLGCVFLRSKQNTKHVGVCILVRPSLGSWWDFRCDSTAFHHRTGRLPCLAPLVVHKTLSQTIHSSRHHFITANDSKVMWITCESHAFAGFHLLREEPVPFADWLPVAEMPQKRTLTGARAWWACSRSEMIRDMTAAGMIHQLDLQV